MIGSMTKCSRGPSIAQEKGTGYQICIRGELDQQWSGWFSGLEISTVKAAERLPLSTISLPTADQAALRGILNKIWDLNLCLVSVQQAGSCPSDEN
jgi:hypothetical protein